MKIAVTGASGKLGRAVVLGLEEAGHYVVGMDITGARSNTFVRVNFADYGQTVDALSSVNEKHDGLDAVVHLAAIPAPGLIPDSETFHNNMNATFNVFQGARRAGIKTIVYASSETLLGLPFSLKTPPPYLPVDEDYPSRPESTYAIVKHLEEELAGKLVRWDPELSITALRFSNVFDAGDYAEVPSWHSDAKLRLWNAWGYIDARDGAQAVLRAVEAKRPGFDTFLIAAADTLMERPSAELAAEELPGVTFKRDVSGTETLLSIDKARRVLGYDPKHSWRDHV